jgi:hypothetical protein
MIIAFAALLLNPLQFIIQMTFALAQLHSDRRGMLVAPKRLLHEIQTLFERSLQRTKKRAFEKGYIVGIA